MNDVVILCEYPTLNGGERSALALVEAIQSSGWNVAFAAPSQGELADHLRRRNLNHLEWNLVDTGGKRHTLPHLRNRLQQSLARWKPAIVHANSLSTARIAGPVASQLGLLSIGHLRDIIKLKRAVIEDLNQNTRLLAVSQATRTWHVAQGLSLEKTFLLYNGVDTDKFRPRAATGFLHRELGLDGEAAIAISIGQIGMRKGLDVTLDAIRRVMLEFPNIHLVIVGQRDSSKEEAINYEAKLRADASRSDLHGHVHFLGRRADVARLLNEVTLLIHSARQEPLGRVLLEAAASGVPTIASQVGGTSEIFPPDTQSALLVPPDDLPALSRAIRDLLRSPSLRASQAGHARARILQQFSSQNAARGLIEHYRQVLRIA